MKTGDHNDRGRFESKIYAVREAAQQDSARVAVHYRELFGIVGDSREGRIDGIKKSTAKPTVLPFVPLNGIVDILFCRIGDNNTANQGRFCRIRSLTSSQGSALAPS